MREQIEQMSLFDFMEVSDQNKITSGKIYNKEIIKLSDQVVNRLITYKIGDYILDIENIGLEKTWDYICQFVIDNNGMVPDFLNVKNFGELYEVGLAIQDKILKKKSGQYYTPDDVAELMSNWLIKCDGDAVCDVACGTGKLILTYLDLIGFEQARALISSGNLYLYDFDNVALKICRTTIAVKYGLDIADSIHDIFCDFLDKSIVLPQNCKVISNPPYAKIEEIQNYWNCSRVLKDTKELYSTFMDKIFSQAKSTVIITPFSFISGAKFKSLRERMCDIGKGFIVSFDNVPGNIFCGRKHGIFNTNTANSVRAAITILTKDSEKKGFRVSPLIRFKNEERHRLLDCNTLEKTLPPHYQVVDESNTMFKKINVELVDIYENWCNGSKYKLKDFLAKDEAKYSIIMPNTCRYFTVASVKKLNRTGAITLYVDDLDKFNFLYCFINSSFTYWWWRIYDGGITYPISLLNEMPIPYNLLDKSDKEFFSTMAKRLIDREESCKVTKVNAGNAQENIKFPQDYRNQINDRILKIIQCTVSHDIFNQIHANKFFQD